jgi:DNA-binding response OmpR family regulator
MAFDSNTILVASADRALVASIAVLLNENGYRVSSTWESSEDEPGLIVLDTAEPSAAQADVLQRHAQAHHQTRPPIVALAPRESVRQTAAQDGVWVCLAKPVEIDNLVLAVDRITRYAAAA